MTGGLRVWLLAVRASYWFVPGVMAVLALLLGAAMIWLDGRVGHEALNQLGWYQQIRSDGARAVLSTIAGSTITVAGVVFSVTIVALSYASGQYGPRLLTNFMNDRGSKVTLGTFIATFVYSLVVLRTIRGGDESFVPQYAVMLAMTLAAASIGVLIYFIHHTSLTIHINHIVARIGEQLIADTRMRFPEPIGAAAPDPMPPPALSGELVPVTSEATGYVQAIEGNRLLRLATEADIIVRLRYRPGDFVTRGRVLAEIASARPVAPGCADSLRSCFAIGIKRTAEHDLMFLVSELVEIAARALSPGINDPMTAIACLDWLGAGASEMAGRHLPAPVRQSEDGKPRLIADPDDFEYFIAQSFGRVRPYAARDPLAGLHLLQVLAEVGADCRDADQLKTLRAEAARFAELAQIELAGPSARAVAARAAELQALLAWARGNIGAGQADRLSGSADLRAPHAAEGGTAP